MTKKYIADVLRKADFCKTLQYFAGTVAIASAFAVLLLVRTEEGFNAYMGCLIPFLVAFAVYYLYAALIRANMIMVFAVSYITVCSLTLMSVIAPSSLSKYIIAIYAVIKLIVTKVRRKKLLLWLVIAMNVLIYAVLLIQPPSEELDYTRAWLVIGGMTFQLTELIKILAVCFLALLYTANLSNKQRLVFLDVFLCINIGGSILIAEFGSLLALLIVLFSGVFVFNAVYYCTGRNCRVVIAQQQQRYNRRKCNSVCSQSFNHQIYGWRRISDRTGYESYQSRLSLWQL